MRIIISLVLFHQLLTLVAYVNSQSTANVCPQTTIAVDDQGSAYGGVKMYFGDSFCQRVIQQDLTNAVKSACPGMNATTVPSAEYIALNTKIDSLDKKAEIVLQKINALIASTAAKTCRAGYELYDQEKFCYKYHMDCKTWTEARQACQQDGGDLISLNDKNFEFFRGLARSKSGSCNNFWVGATDAAAEGVWNWLNGDKFNTTLWAPQQPDNWGNVENCVTFAKMFDFKLNDENCSLKHHFVCRVSY
ncbi:hypothetical protein ACJMK2_032062 [Sinanodonta woodiana]|uniref:C-type lectin domain-containing protein n=1 Tax=Sinanodonta woodiana TaxID=1069815 RepID=A0ABD3X2E6_SINWO